MNEKKQIDVLRLYYKVKLVTHDGYCSDPCDKTVENDSEKYFDIKLPDGDLDAKYNRFNIQCQLGSGYCGDSYGTIYKLKTTEQRIENTCVELDLYDGSLQDIIQYPLECEKCRNNCYHANKLLALSPDMYVEYCDECYEKVPMCEDCNNKQWINKKCHTCYYNSKQVEIEKRHLDNKELDCEIL